MHATTTPFIKEAFTIPNRGLFATFAPTGECRAVPCVRVYGPAGGLLERGQP